MNFEKMSDEELQTERGQLDAALRMAVSHGTELPQAVKDQLQAMNNEIVRRKEKAKS